MSLTTRPLKSCTYCRYRKKRCVKLEGSTRCKSCEYVDVECVFIDKKPSNKRRVRSQEIATRVLKHKEPDSFGKTPYGLFTKLQPIFPPGETSDGSESPDTKPSTAKQRYMKHVEPLTPFLSYSILETCTEKLSRFVDIAASMSLHAKTDDTMLKQQVIEMTWQMDLDTALGIMILAFRLDLDPELIISATSVLLANSKLGLEVRVGACVANIWVRAIYPNLDKIDNQDDYLTAIDEFLALDKHKQTIGHQYTILARAMMILQTCEIQNNVTDVETFWQIEQTLLNFPVNLPRDLIDLRDEMPSTAGAIIVHIFYNTVMMRYYTYILRRRELLTRLVLTINPTMIHYVNAIALTIFRAGPDVQNKWWLVVECQAITAKCMLKMLEISRNENSLRVLDFWRPYIRFNDLKDKVNNAVGEGPWTTEELDGYSVFWTFRDTRQLMVDYLLREVRSQTHRIW